MRSEPVYLNTLGFACPLGISAEQVFNNLMSHSQCGLKKHHGLISGKQTWVGAVDETLVELPVSFAKYHCRNNQLLATAYQQIAEDVEALKVKIGASRIGVVIGTSTSGIAESEAAVKQYLSTGDYPTQFNYTQQEIGSGSRFLAEYAGVTGIEFTVSTACSSSGKAIAAAQRLIASGHCDAVIVGGADSLCEITLNGFDTLELVSSNISNPYSKNRQGLNIGEGATLFILSKTPSAIQLLGCGESSDGYHVSSPDPSGLGAISAMNHALKNAALRPEDIGYINLHGTATQKNDEMEAAALHAIFSSLTPCSSTKSLMGHTLGAAAAIELGLCWLLLSDLNKEHHLPQHLYDGVDDESLLAIHLVAQSEQWDKPTMMSNSFAFGGSNVSLIIGREQ